MSDAKISEDTVIATPLRNIISIIAAVAVGTWAYFGVIERLNQIETNITLMQNDVVENTNFRIKWPRGEMGSLPADSEQFMLIEHLAGELEKLTKEIEGGQAPFDQQQKLQIEFMMERIKGLEDQHEKMQNSIMDLIHQLGNVPNISNKESSHAGH
ncbi:MAG: hypothetical protein L7T60_06675 [Flavobacteriaceae bacterium]|nr:hypothetical protein [Flavobacteriaceae bacterium]